LFDIILVVCYFYRILDEFRKNFRLPVSGWIFLLSLNTASKTDREHLCEGANEGHENQGKNDMWPVMFGRSTWCKMSTPARANLCRLLRGSLHCFFFINDFSTYVSPRTRSRESFLYRILLLYTLVFCCTYTVYFVSTYTVRQFYYRKTFC